MPGVANKLSDRAREDQRLVGQIKPLHWLESGGVYGYRKIQFWIFVKLGREPAVSTG